jgi:GNAT superfamily N-acetyltransferase
MKLSASDVRFHEASRSQRETSWRQNGVSWAKPLSIEDYVVRENELSETEIAANGGNKYWVLTRINAPEDVVCACETTRKVVFYGGKGGYREVTGYSIASVFTKPEYRGQGMAGILCNELKKWLDGEGGAEICSLYSDIGAVSTFLSLNFVR